MPDVREMLVELESALRKSMCRGYDDVTDIEYIEYEETAKNLIANGVTIATDTNVGSKWIPVTERLPDTFGTFIVAVRIPTRKRTYSDSADFDPFAKKWTPSLYWGKGMNVTHWMPLPEPPKEDE